MQTQRKTFQIGRRPAKQRPRSLSNNQGRVEKSVTGPTMIKRGEGKGSDREVEGGEGRGERREREGNRGRGRGKDREKEGTERTGKGYGS